MVFLFLGYNNLGEGWGHLTRGHWNKLSRITLDNVNDNAIRQLMKNEWPEIKTIKVTYVCALEENRRWLMDKNKR